MMLRGPCHEGIAVPGQFCVEVITLHHFFITFADIQNVPAELQERYQANFIREHKAC